MMIDLQREAKRIDNQAARTGREDVMLPLDEWIVSIHPFRDLCASCQEKPFEVLDHLVPAPAQAALSKARRFGISLPELVSRLIDAARREK